MEIKVYANYGELGHEKLPCYRTVKGDISEEKTVIIPDEFKVYENQFGETLIETPDGMVMTLNEIMNNTSAGNPAFYWVDKNMQRHMVRLDLKENAV